MLVKKVFFSPELCTFSWRPEVLHVAGGDSVEIAAFSGLIIYVLPLVSRKLSFGHRVRTGHIRSAWIFTVVIASWKHILNCFHFDTFWLRLFYQGYRFTLEGFSSPANPTGFVAFSLGVFEGRWKKPQQKIRFSLKVAMCEMCFIFFFVEHS